VEEFLIALLTDKEVIRTSLPSWVHRFLFTRVAKKRGIQVVKDYALIGGKSPIFEDTQEIAAQVGALLGSEVMTFHRYLPKTHGAFIEKMKGLLDVDVIRVFPLFPQFSYATTGSIALWLSKHLPKEIFSKMQCVKSYPSDPLYIGSMCATLKGCLEERGWDETEVCLLFSAHGLPQQFIDTGDPYQQECELSFSLIKEQFPQAVSLLSYQSQFGKQPWILPYTSLISGQIKRYAQGRKKVVIIPLSFTSDHVETLYEIEYAYVAAIRAQGLEAHRCPALNLKKEWIETVAHLFAEAPLTQMNRALRR
jgi:ferrochelatase